MAKQRKVSPETRAKQSAAMKRKYANPEFAARHAETMRKVISEWHSDPKNAAAFAKRSSERMKRRHADPEWQKVRNARSSRVMKQNWENNRDLFVQQSIDRYQRMKETGTGIVSEQAESRKRKANAWIMKKASRALHSETNYNEVYAEVQERIRNEQPFDPKGDYYEYLKWLGSQVVNSPECRQIADTFLSKAIPRFAKEWQQRKGSA